jgi:hypothetical protein
MNVVHLSAGMNVCSNNLFKATGPSSEIHTPILCLDSRVTDDLNPCLLGDAVHDPETSHPNVLYHRT